MTLAEKIVAALIMKDETIATLEAEIETLKAEAQELEKVRDYFDADVPASVEPVPVAEEKLPDWATPPDPALVPVQIDVPVSM
jgi:restriction endonuclease S subunit